MNDNDLFRLEIPPDAPAGDVARLAIALLMCSLNATPDKFLDIGRVYYEKLPANLQGYFYARDPE